MYIACIVSDMNFFYSQYITFALQQDKNCLSLKTKVCFDDFYIFLFILLSSITLSREIGNNLLFLLIQFMLYYYTYIENNN